MARVLIVDDEEMDRVVQSSILRDAGHEVVFASDGETALKIHRSSPLDLVVTDLAMPNLNGLRLIQELVKVDPWIPILAISGVNAEMLDLAEDYGAFQTLCKPVDAKGLLEAVDDALDKTAHRSGP